MLAARRCSGVSNLRVFVSYASFVHKVRLYYQMLWSQPILALWLVGKTTLWTKPVTHITEATPTEVIFMRNEVVAKEDLYA